MAAQIAIGNRSGRENLRRLAVVFAVELRLKIISELYMREMSPTEFHRQFGGGSASRVARNFAILEEHGWISYVRSAPGKGGRGVENFYRATDLAFIDSESWAEVPYSMRVASSWNIFNQIAIRMREATEASWLGRHPTLRSLRLDEEGWKRVIDCINVQFVSLFEEQTNAELRVRHSGEELIRVDVLQIAFEAPKRSDKQGRPTLAEIRHEPLVPLHERLAPVFADDICMQIMVELNQREMSVPQFHREFGGISLSGTYRRFWRLTEIGLLAKVREDAGGGRRGRTEIFYRAAVPAIEGSPFADAPDLPSRAKNLKAFEQLTNQINASMKAAVFDKRPSRILALTFLSLDQQGLERVVKEMDTLLDHIVVEQDYAKHRMRKSGEKPIRMVVAQAVNESPKDATKAP